MSAPRRPHEAETAALVDALGDFLLFLQREKQLRRAKSRRKGAAGDADADRKRTMLAWLRALSEAEWMSMCTVIDAGFVKTVLAMGMAARTAEAEKARRRRTCSVSRVTRGATEFQLIPRDDATAKRALEATAPSDFLRRPVMRTRDGDTLAGFQSQLFVDACGSLEQAIYIVNTTRSCDTLSVVAADDSTRTDWLSRIDTISGGQFLLNCPSDQELQQQSVWSQTAWFASRAYFALPELIVNRIEMAVWFHWSQLQKSTNYRIPVQGVAAKHLFAAEWAISCEARKYEALQRVSSQVMEHLKQLAPPTTRAMTRTAQLATLSGILAAWQTSSTKKTFSTSASVVMFAQSLERILNSPQAAAVSFLVAELLQDECAKIVTEHLLEPPSNGSHNQPKSTHAQRRRAARKKIAKQRKHESESRHAHERLQRAVCAEIPRAVKQWHDRSFEAVREVLAAVVDSVVAALDSPTNIFLPEDTTGASGSVFRARRKKKRGKKKSNKTKNLVEASEHNDYDASLAVAFNTKENHLHNGNMDSQSTVDGGEKVNGTRSDSEQSVILRPEIAPRPLLSFFPSSDDHSYPTRTSTFGTHPFYSMTSSLYLQAPSSHIPEADDDDEDADVSTLQGNSSAVGPGFDWYLPSLFSSQSSAHTSSTVSSLDWDFHRWNTKTDNQSRTSAATKSQKLRPLLKTPVESVSPVRSIASPASAAVGEDGSSTESNFPLNAFANIIDIDDEASVKSDAVEDEVPTVPETLVEQDEDEERSDFLYREGGFFDRQRGAKRRRRPFPFEYDDDNADDGSVDGAGGERSWGHRLSNTSERGRVSIRSDASTNNSTTCACKTRGADNDDRLSRENALLADRISKLERLFEERTVQNVDENNPSLSAELNGLQQQVTMLSEQIVSLETELVEVRRARKNASEEEHPRRPPPLSISELQQPPAPDQDHPFPVPLVSSAQSYPHPIMRPGGASNYSLLGPFVSVPMSVLPPRSKLHWDMCEFVSQLQNDSNARLSTQMAAIRFCTSAVQSLWPRAQVRPYGSFVTRLALPTSDVDLVICLPKVRRDAPAEAAGVLEGRNAIKESWQQNLARKLRQEPWVVADSVKTIPHAAIPIISLTTNLPFNVRLDISFEGPGHNGLATNDVVLSLMHEFPPLAPIMLVLKSFVIERGFAVAYSGGLSSYALLLMVARYLQEHTDRYENNSTASTSSADFGMVLMGLLDFYGNRFEPRTTGISVAARCFFNRDSIVSTHQHGYAPPNAMHSVDDAQDHWQQLSHSHMHSANLLSSPGSRRHNNRTSMNDWPAQRANGIPDSLAPHDPHKFDPLFIEDPLHPSNNVGRNCFRITQIRRAFAAGYEILMAASMSTFVFSENRTPAIGGVALHPENILRAILGPNSPAFTSAAHTKNENGAVAVPPTFQPPKPRGSQRPTQNGARYAPPIVPLYDQQHTQAPFVGGVPYYNGSAGGATMPPPYMLQRTQAQYHQQMQYPQQHGHGKPQPRSAESGGNYRRHSESVTEHMTTRSEAASSAAKFFAKRGNGIDRSQSRSPRLMPPTMHRSSSIELDKIGGNASSSVDSNGAGRGMTSRKCPTRSMSFADVVMSGGGAATVEHQRKTPSSPLALMRSARRNDSRFEEAIVERLETKDDFELK